MLNKIRRTEMPLVYEPLALNCDLLFVLADKTGLSDSDKKKVDNILHPDGDRLFLTESIDNQYWFDNVYPGYSQEDVDIEFDGTDVSLPASLLTGSSSIKVTDSSKKDLNISDWSIDKVERGVEGNITTFTAVYSSKAAKNNEWKPNANIHIVVKPVAKEKMSYTFKYKTKGTKDNWYDYLKVWEGKKNHWYDYAKVWENSVKFVRVE